MDYWEKREREREDYWDQIKTWQDEECKLFWETKKSNTPSSLDFVIGQICTGFNQLACWKYYGSRSDPERFKYYVTKEKKRIRSAYSQILQMYGTGPLQQIKKRVRHNHMMTRQSLRRGDESHG